MKNIIYLLLIISTQSCAVLNAISPAEEKKFLQNAAPVKIEIAEGELPNEYMVSFDDGLPESIDEFVMTEELYKEDAVAITALWFIAVREYNEENRWYDRYFKTILDNDYFNYKYGRKDGLKESTVTALEKYLKYINYKDYTLSCWQKQNSLQYCLWIELEDGVHEGEVIAKLRDKNFKYKILVLNDTKNGFKVKEFF